jgi:hypothetical protein
MAAGDKIIVPAMAAGFVSLFGQISKGAGDTVHLPEGMANIGGNGFGYLLAPAVNWDPLAAGNNDGSFAALALGDNIYIYAVRQASGTAKWVASKNSTVPTGYDAASSRKIGGFHVGRYRGVANRYNTAYAPVTQILPNSCWDLAHRPTCDPTGMVEVIPGSLWVDIYPNSEGAGLWPENVPVSVYGATIIRDTIYSRSDFHQLINNAGKRLPTVEEFLRYAEGAPAGLDGSNDQAWSMTTNTGPTTAGGVAKAVSQYNVVDAVGNVWDWLDSHHDIGDYNGSVTPYAWDAAVVNVGKDAAYPRGSVDHAAWGAFIGGGPWLGGVLDGARCLYSSAVPWDADGRVGLRGVCDSL